MASHASRDPESHTNPSSERKWRSFFGKQSTSTGRSAAATESQDTSEQEDKVAPTKWSMGVLNDRQTYEVPGSVLLLTGARNEPLGMRNAPARTSASSIPSAVRVSLQSRRQSAHEAKKKTPDGAIILEPQPDDSHNDPLNWPSWRRDSALLSLGFYCMIGGGMTPILAAGFTNVASDFDVSVPQVALTTGLYMMGLGVGSVFASPTAILFGKRPVYLVGCVLFIGCSAWCAASPSYGSLVAARVFQGIAVSPVECLPSATIAEIYFLHERAYRIGVYTLLLLGGKNLVPLVSAAIIQSLSWRWVFWIVTFIGAFCLILLFLFVPETFWDRSPRPKDRSHPRKSSFWSLKRVGGHADHEKPSDLGGTDGSADETNLRKLAASNSALTSRPQRSKAAHSRHVGFAGGSVDEESGAINNATLEREQIGDVSEQSTSFRDGRARDVSDPIEGSTKPRAESPKRSSTSPARHELEKRIMPEGLGPPTPGLHNFNSPFYLGVEKSDSDFLSRGRLSAESQNDGGRSIPNDGPLSDVPPQTSVSGSDVPIRPSRPAPPVRYTTFLKEQPKQTFVQQLKPWNGRLHTDNWFRVAIRPFVLFAYPAVLWSAVVYSCSIGWLIVISESVAEIYRSKDTYNFSALSTGLIYISPFVGGILGTAVAGKVSDMIVRSMSRRNGGLYEPEFRLVMAIPIAITTVIGLMGYGWSAEEHDAWIVPTIFFGVISFGCSLGSTTAITFCVDSYRQYAGEALVTLNFSKNIFHGLVFSLFFNSWLAADGARKVFIALGCIQLGLLAFTIPMYIYGKRARMWTVRMNLMERF